MWLLNTKTLQMKLFPNTPPIPYAILSHVWQRDEQKYNFQKINNIYDEFCDTVEGAVAHAPDKVRKFCILAAAEGYEWAWLDSSCIDKTSSAELSEAINSMYVWYAAADTCYAYLYDVCDADNPFEPDSDFRRCEWHDRGWTLQELLAPKRIVFLSGSWHFFGTKASLVTPLAERTGIDRNVLLGIAAIETQSVAQRMSWAAAPETTREEDRAYALMGIFGVNMPVIYGEGAERAFLRLQKEVIAVCPDHSIFAWGSIHSNLYATRTAIERYRASKNCEPAAHAQPKGRAGLQLLATSPAAFAHSGGMRRFDPRLYQELFGHPVDHKCTFSADGIAVSLPTWSRFLHLDEDHVMYAVALACGTSEDSAAATAGASMTGAGSPAAIEETSTAGETIPTQELVSIVFLFLTGLHGDVDHLDDSAQELSFQYVGQLARDEAGQVTHCRGATLHLPIFLRQWRLHSTIQLRAFFSELAYIHLRDLRINAGRGTLPSFIATSEIESYGTVALPRNCTEYVVEVPYWVFDRLKTFYGFVSSASTIARQTVHQACRFTLRGGMGSHTDQQPSFYILFTNSTHTETIGLVFSVQCQSTVVRTRNQPCIRVFYTQGDVDLGDHDGVLAALDAHELLPEDASNGHAHLSATPDGGPQPLVFPVGARAVRIWTTFFDTSSHEEHHASIGRVVVSMDLVGFTRV